MDRTWVALLVAALPGLVSLGLAIGCNWSGIKRSMVSVLSSQAFGSVVADVLVQLSTIGALFDYAVSQARALESAKDSQLTRLVVDLGDLNYVGFAILCWLMALAFKLLPVQRRIGARRSFWAIGPILRSRAFRQLASDVLIQVSVTAAIVAFMLDVPADKMPATGVAAWAISLWVFAFALRRPAKFTR